MTADRNFRPTRTLAREHVFVVGSFTVDGAGNITSQNCLGATAIDGSSTTSWAIELDDKYGQYCGSFANIIDVNDPTNGFIITTVDPSLPFGGIMLLYRDLAGTPLTPAAGSTIHFTISLRRVADKY